MGRRTKSLAEKEQDAANRAFTKLLNVYRKHGLYVQEDSEEGSAELINLSVRGQVLAPPAASAHARLALCALLALLLSRATFASLLALG
jgi:hypothetical protein